jgi:hypothetical protein
MGIIFDKCKKPQSRVTEYDKAILVKWHFCYYGVMFVV